MHKKKVIIGVFSKTPGLSVLKSRLSKTIGKEKSEEFYRLSLDCLKENFKILRTNFEFDLVYLTSEEESSGHIFWENEKVIEQGAGSFGEKLYRCYKNLSKLYEKVIIIGGDSPGLDSSILQKAINTLDHTEYVIGPANDGGFYLIGSSAHINQSVWLGTKYSCDSTLKDFISRLNTSCKIAFLPEVIDIDYYEDLLDLEKTLLVNCNTQIYAPLLRFISKIKELYCFLS